MTFQNVEMTDEEIDWERTLDIKDPRLSYKISLDGRPDGCDMTVDRDRKIYLFGLLSDNGREPPSETTLHYFFLLWEGGRLYFSAHQEIQYDADGMTTEVVWHIAKVDLFQNDSNLSRKQILAFLSEALEKYGEDGVGWEFEPPDPEIPGRANYDGAIFTGNWRG